MSSIKQIERAVESRIKEIISESPTCWDIQYLLINGVKLEQMGGEVVGIIIVFNKAKLVIDSQKRVFVSIFDTTYQTFETVCKEYFNLFALINEHIDTICSVAFWR